MLLPLYYQWGGTGPEQLDYYSQVDFWWLYGVEIYLR